MGFHVYVNWKSHTALMSVHARARVDTAPFCTVCVFISSFHKCACAHVFGQDKKRANRTKGKAVTGGRERDTQREAW